jgi:hypothetical protein
MGRPVARWRDQVKDDMKDGRERMGSYKRNINRRTEKNEEGFFRRMT